MLGLLVGQVEGLFAAVAEPGPQLRGDAAAFTDENRELGIGRLDGDVVLLDELANAGAGGRLLAKVEPDFFQNRRELDGLRCDSNCCLLQVLKVQSKG